MIPSSSEIMEKTLSRILGMKVDGINYMHFEVPNVEFGCMVTSIHNFQLKIKMNDLEYSSIERLVREEWI